MESELQKELADTFRAEAAEFLVAIQRDLLALEKGASPAERRRLVAQIFRDCHSLKGSAGTLGFTDVEKVAHHLEGALHRVQKGEARLGPGLADAILGSLDAVRAAIDPAGAGLPETAARIEAAVLALAQVAGPVAPLAPHRPTQFMGEDRGWQGERHEESMVGARRDTPNRDAPDRFDPKVLEALAELAPGQVPPPPLGIEAPPVPEPPLGEAEETIRVPAAELDALVRRMGDVATAKIRTERRLSEVREVTQMLEGAVRRLREVRAAPFLIEPLLVARRRSEQTSRELSQDALHMATVTSALSKETSELRMVPVTAAFEPLRRLVRDLARRQNKDVRLVLSGAEARLDKRILEQIRTPLVHLVRNAVAHGAEPPEERLRGKKPRECTVEVATEAREGTIAIWVADDGRGVDPAEIRDAAVRKGLLTVAEAARLDDRRALDLIFAAGFSLRDTVDEISGRGIGLDVVRANTARLGGRVEVETHVGRGSRFTLVLPLTMTTVRGLFVRAGGETFAVPIAAVDRVARFSARAVSRPGDSIVLDGRPVSLVRLEDLLGMPASHPGADAPIVAVVLAAGDRRAAFVVQEVAAEGEMVLKGLGPQLRRVPMIAGATVLADGRLVLVLDAADLVMAASQDAAVRAKAAARTPRRALVVDDSISTRTFLKRLLEGSGLDVVTAADGEEAMDLLEASGCDIIVSDVNMPRLDGLGLVRRVRGHPRMKDIPVVLVSALGEDVEKTAGLQAGADAYIAKREFERGDVLRVVQRLMARHG